MKLGIIGATGWLGQALGLRLIGEGVWPEGDILEFARLFARYSDDMRAAYPA